MADFAVASPANPSSPSPSDRHSKDISGPLSLDTPAPSSPFPSPSSSFVPPPMPSAHEFANKPPTGRFTRRRKSSSPPNVRQECVSDPQDNQTLATKTEERNTPNGVTASLNINVLSDDVSAGITPITPTPASLALTPTLSVAPQNTAISGTVSHSTPTQTHITLPSPPPSPSQIFSTATAVAPTLHRALSGSGTASKHTSLSSSRPAPASPAPSRRQSGAPSLRSRHRSGLSTASTSLKSSSLLPPAKRRGEIKIRDFAFPSVDARHTGRGPDTPRVIKRLLKQHGPDLGSRRASGMSESSVDSEGSSRRSSGFGAWSALRWAGKIGGGWGFGASNSGASSGNRVSAAAGGYTPNQLDFERNFDDGGEVDLVGSPHDVEDEAYLSDYDNEDDVDGESELLPGLYRALYDFEPEGTAEMGLKEGQMVTIVGRGGGVGWAVAVRPATEGNDEDAGESNWALVPESYLKLVKVDDSEPNGEDGISLSDTCEVEVGEQVGS